MLRVALVILLQAGIAVPQGGVVDLAGPWRFRAGDSAVFAQAALDDAAWDTLSVPRRWAIPGAPDGQGYGWYRLRYALDSVPREPLGIRFKSVATAFEVFVDGHRVGAIGGFPPRYRARSAVPVVFALPTATLAPGQHLIAVRVYSAEETGGILGRVQLGPLSDLGREDQGRNLSLLATAMLLLGIGTYQILYWLRRPQAFEHLFIFLSCLALACFFVSWMPAVRLALEPWANWYRLYLSLGSASAAAFGFAVRRIFELEDDRLLALISAYFLLLVPLALFLPAWEQVRFVGSRLMNAGLVVWGAGIVGLVLVQARRGTKHARPLLWGTLILLVTLLHDVLADWGVQLVRSNFAWLTLVGAVAFVASLALTTAQKFVETETAALYDRLTGLYRREVVMDALTREIRRAARTHQPLAVIMLDVDRFKQVNDTLGHQAGDRVLAEIGRRLAEAGRAVDWLGRYGGEEFLAVLASTHVPGAEQAAERLRQAVAALPIPVGRTTRTITLSAGVAAYDGGEDWPTVEQIVGGADAALYRAKAAGRNQVAT